MNFTDRTITANQFTLGVILNHSNTYRGWRINHILNTFTTCVFVKGPDTISVTTPKALCDTERLDYCAAAAKDRIDEIEDTVDDPDNRVVMSYDNGRELIGVNVDELTISTAAGVCWLHLEALGDGDFYLDIGDARINLHVNPDGKVFQNVEREEHYPQLAWGDVVLNDPLEVVA